MLILFLLNVAVYLKFLFPTFALGDGGLFSAAAVGMGVVLPPGYPLYTMLGKLAQLFFPLSSPAWRLNFLTALLMAAAVVMTVWSLRELGFSKAVSLLAGQWLALAPAVLRNSLSAEVYSLNLFFLSLIFFLLLKQRWFLTVLFFGLSMTNHYIMFLYLPAFVLFWIKCDQKKWRQAVLLVFLLFLGLFGYVYLPLRAAVSPAVNWGKPYSWFYFSQHVKRSHFQSLEFATAVKPAEKLRFTVHFFKEGFWRQFPYGLGILAFIGLFLGVRGKNQTAYFLLIYVYLVTGLGLIWGLSFPFNATNIYRFAPYLLPSWWALSPGFAVILSLIRRKGVERFNRPLIQAVFAGFLVVPLFLTFTFDAFSRRSYMAYDLGSNILGALPHEAVLFNRGSNQAFSLCYLIAVEERRPDLRIYDRGGVILTGLLEVPLFKISAQEWEIRRNAKEAELIQERQFPVYYTRAQKRPLLNPYFRLQPLGPVYRVIFSGEQPSSLPPYVFRDQRISTADFWLNYERSRFYLNLANALQGDGQAKNAKKALTKAVELDPSGQLARAIKNK